MKRQPEVSIREMLKNCDAVARLMKSIAHPKRLMLLCHLSNGRKTVGELVNLCKVSQSASSQFLNRMKYEGVITSIKSGKHVYYLIDDPKIKSLIVQLHRIFCHS